MKCSLGFKKQRHLQNTLCSIRKIVRSGACFSVPAEIVALREDTTFYLF